MAHAFDHGLAKPLRTLVRNGVVAALAPLLATVGCFGGAAFDSDAFASGPAGGYLKSIGPFAVMIRGREDDVGLDHAFEVLSGRAPAVLVALGDLPFDETGATGHAWHGDLTVQVLVFSQHARSLEDRLAGGDAAATASNSADPGLEVMLEHVRELLIGNDLGIGPAVWQLRPELEQELGTSKAETLWAQTYRVKVNGSVLEHRTALIRIAEFLTTWRAKAEPGGDPVHTFTTETASP